MLASASRSDSSGVTRSVITVTCIGSSEFRSCSSRVPAVSTCTSANTSFVVVFSGRYEKVHYALAMASAAVAVNKPATLFFTMEAIRGLGKEDGTGNPGWHALKAQDGRAARARDEDFAATSCAIQNILLAAVDLQLGTYLRTGALIEDDGVRELLGVPDDHRIVGTIYLGYPTQAPRTKRRTSAAEKTRWLD